MSVLTAREGLKPSWLADRRRDQQQYQNSKVIYHVLCQHRGLFHSQRFSEITSCVSKGFENLVGLIHIGPYGFTQTYPYQPEFSNMTRRYVLLTTGDNKLCFADSIFSLGFRLANAASVLLVIEFEPPRCSQPCLLSSWPSGLV